MTTIYLIRHGAYENPLGVFHGRSPGFPLSAKGKQQAARMAKFLKDKPVTAIYSSRLTRAHETAAIIAGQFGLPVWTDERLLDIRSPLEGKPVELLRALPLIFYHPEFIAAGGERLEEVFDRMNHFIRQKVADHPNEHIVVVSHGDGIMSIVSVYGGKKLPKFYPYDSAYVAQACGYQIELTGTTVRRIKPIP